MSKSNSDFRDNSAVVVLSGGQDSTTCLFIAKSRHARIHALTFDYGQRHRIEIQCAKDIAKLAQVVKHDILTIPEGFLRSASPLTTDIPLEQYESFEQMEQVIGSRREATFVPMRNALFLTIAANYAEAYGIANIYTGVCQEDNANYDDCREVFIQSVEQYVNLALGYDHRPEQGNPIRIHAPLIGKSKAETIECATKLPGCMEALAYSHTSYAGDYPPLDRNHATILREQGFQEAGIPDPLVLRAVSEGLMPLPLTSNYDSAREGLVSAWQRKAVGA